MESNETTENKRKDGSLNKTRSIDRTEPISGFQRIMVKTMTESLVCILFFR